MDHLSELFFVKALVALVFVVCLIWGATFLLRFFKFSRDTQRVHRLTRVLDICHLDAQRKLIVFSSPFGQGLVLVSPRGDQLSFFPKNPTTEASVE